MTRTPLPLPLPLPLPKPSDIHGKKHGRKRGLPTPGPCSAFGLRAARPSHIARFARSGRGCCSEH